MCERLARETFVYADTVRSYEFSKRLAEEIIATRWDSIAGQIDTRGEGVPVVVFNLLGWSREDIAEGIEELGIPSGRIGRATVFTQRGWPRATDSVWIGGLP